MELATGKVRYEFSGPGADGWYAAFLPDGRGFLASQLFDRTVALWPTDHPATDDRTPPKPKLSLGGLADIPESVDVSVAGNIALALPDGAVVLRRLEGEAPPLAPHAGTGPSAVTFTPSGRHLVALRGGRLSAWLLPDRERTAPAAGSR